MCCKHRYVTDATARTLQAAESALIAVYRRLILGIDACFADGSAADYASPQTTEARGGMRRCKSGIRSAAC